MKSGIIALIFLLIGFESALFYRAAVLDKVLSNRDHPDTVFVERLPEISYGEEQNTASVRKNSYHNERASEIRRESPPRTVESFRFNPNTVSSEDLVRLGFSPAQAESILNYRAKGGRFNRPSDFAKSYVVSDSVYQRLQKYIDIPKLDLNLADSTALDDLPGIGPYFASRIVKHRTELGGFYCCKEQLLDIYHFDQEKLSAISDLIYVSKASIKPFELWTLSENELKLHPYIRDWKTAHAIVLYRQSYPRESWQIDSMAKVGAISPELKNKLRNLVIAEP